MAQISAAHRDGKTLPAVVAAKEGSESIAQTIPGVPFSGVFGFIPGKSQYQCKKLKSGGNARNNKPGRCQTCIFSVRPHILQSVWGVPEEAHKNIGSVLTVGVVPHKRSAGYRTPKIWDKDTACTSWHTDFGFLRSQVRVRCPFREGTKLHKVMLLKDLSENRGAFLLFKNLMSQL